MTQPSLFSRAPAVKPEDVERVQGALKGHGWVSAGMLAFALGGTDRKLRAIASASQGRIISGQRGYCLIEEATVEEANHAAAWLEHQAAEMQRRARDIRKAMHKRSAA